LERQQASGGSTPTGVAAQPAAGSPMAGRRAQLKSRHSGQRSFRSIRNWDEKRTLSWSSLRHGFDAIVGAAATPDLFRDLRAKSPRVRCHRSVADLLPSSGSPSGRIQQNSDRVDATSYLGDFSGRGAGRGEGAGGGGGGGGNKRGEEEAGRAHGALYAERVTPRQPPRHHRTGPLPRSATDR
jgi:hypothetical protein